MSSLLHSTNYVLIYFIFISCLLHFDIFSEYLVFWLHHLPRSELSGFVDSDGDSDVDVDVDGDGDGDSDEVYSKAERKQKLRSLYNVKWMIWIQSDRDQGYDSEQNNLTKVGENRSRMIMMLSCLSKHDDSHVGEVIQDLLNISSVNKKHQSMQRSCEYPEKSNAKYV